jgi:hypothetical protein
VSRCCCSLRLCCRCVLELHAIASKKAEGGGRFAVAMTARENRRFLSGIESNHTQYYSMLGRVNAETSECSRAADRESIHEAIRRSVGFAGLNRMVFGVMEGWMEETLRAQAAASAAAGDDEMAMAWNSTLACVLVLQGRNTEAAGMQEASLKFFRRALPDNHPVIGVNFCFFLIDVAFFNSIRHRLLDAESGVHVQYAWTAPRCPGS